MSSQAEPPPEYRDDLNTAREQAATAVRDAFLVPPAERRARWRALCYYGAFGMFLFSLGLWFVNASRHAREAAMASQCRGHFCGIALALHNYADAYGSFPPPFIADEQGRPMHSWRVLILPFIDQKDLYSRYRFDEPWDGPNNRQLHSESIRLFNCTTRFPDEDSPLTSYLAVVGPDTVWPESGTVRPQDVTNGLRNTLMVVEVGNSDVHWMEPRDLHVLQMAPTINPKSGQGISSPHYLEKGAHAVMVDGSSCILPNSLSADEVRGMLGRESATTPLRARSVHPLKLPEKVRAGAGFLLRTDGEIR
jgi:hypothetical protein